VEPMGSLMPGWNAPHQVPKGLEEDYQNEPIDFRKRSLNLVPPHAQLRRSSMEPRTPASPRSPPAAALTGHLRRGSTGDAHTVKLATTPHAEASTPTCEPSEDEAASARGWWKRMDSATYNEAVLEEDPSVWRHGSYMPQHVEARQGISEDGAICAECLPH